MTGESGDKVRTYRASDEIYDPALEVATRRGESLSAEIRDFLVRYVKRDQRRQRRQANTTTTTEENSK